MITYPISNNFSKKISSAMFSALQYSFLHQFKETEINSLGKLKIKKVREKKYKNRLIKGAY